MRAPGWPQLWISMAVAGVLAAPARAAVVEATSTTLIQGRSEPNAEGARTVVPMIEMVGLTARDIGNPVLDDLSLQVTAWGRLSPVDPDSSRLDNAADLDLAYLAGTLLDRRLGLKLGRHLIFGGAARATQIDGVSGEVRLVRGVGVQAWGGLPVIPRFAVGTGDALGGGRLFWRHSVDAEVGASFLQLWDGGDTARQEVGLDARYLPLKSLTLAGYGTLSTIESRFSEGDLRAQWQPFWPDGRLELSVDARHTAPDLFVSRTSIFSVFAAERRQEYGGGVFYRFAPQVSAWADYHLIRIESDTGHEAMARANWRPLWGTNLGLQGKLFRVPRNGFTEARAYASQRLTEKVALMLDLDGYFFREPVNGKEQSYVASASGTWQFAPGWMAALTGLGSVTPFFERRLEVLGKLIYNFSTKTREVTP